MTAALRRIPPTLTFATAAALVYAVELWIARSGDLAARPGTLGPAMAFDLAVFVPALYWLLVKRRGAGSWLGFFAVLTLAWAAAPLVLPPAQRHYLAALLVLAPAAEAVCLGYAAGRLRRVARAYRAWTGDPTDVLVRLRHACTVGLGDQPVWRALSDELAMWRYAVAPPRPTEAPGAGAPTTIFTHHRRSAWAAVVVAIGLVGIIETVALHLLVALWSARAAWLLTFFSIYAVAWLVADLRACARRPLVLGEALLVRVGLRWTARIPYAAIVAVTRPRASALPPRRAPGYLRATVFGQPTLLLELACDVVAEGPYALRRRVRLVGLSPDDPAAFLSALSSHLPQVR